ncbi:MAG: IS110 family transposase [Pseudomonadota bacterium]
MTRDDVKPAQSILVAIDVAKYRNEALIAIPGKKRRRISFRHTLEDYRSLCDRLLGFGLPVQIGFEPTGDYHRPMAWHFHQQGFELYSISSLAMARTREAMHNSWDKNDPKDAQVILHMMRTGLTQIWYDPLVHGINDLQELSKTHEVISKTKTEFWHRLCTHYLPLYFPEAERFRNSTRSDWFLAFLEVFPTPASIVCMEREAFIEAAWDVVGKKQSKYRLIDNIYSVAVDSIGLPIAEESRSIAMFKLVLSQGRDLIARRDAIEQHAEDLLGERPDFQRLKTIPGIGPIHALTVLAEAGDLRRFRHHRQFLKYCGFNLSTHQSGIFRGQTKLSKFGNARLRRAFWMAGQVAIRQRENSFRDKYRRYIKKDPDNGDLKRKAMTAVAAKMARTAFAVIKTETDYRPFLESVGPRRRDLPHRAVEAHRATS